MGLSDDTLTSPDSHGSGLTEQRLNALRYDGHVDHPLEIAGMLRSMMPSNSRVLDVGCGTGSVTLIANRDKHNSVIGVEPDVARFEAARSRGIDAHNTFVDGAFLEQHGTFDVVMLADVLEHTASPGDFLRTIKSALKAEGCLLISVPNVAHWSVRLNLLVGRFDYESVGIMDSTHLRWFTLKTFVNLLTESGFELVEIRQTAAPSLPPYGRGIFRFIPRRVKSPAIATLTRIFPLLFGVQHVAKARLLAPEDSTRAGKALNRVRY
jgi:methionine biosynthesis protein MetW